MVSSTMRSAGSCRSSACADFRCRRHLLQSINDTVLPAPGSLWCLSVRQILNTSSVTSSICFTPSRSALPSFVLLKLSRTDTGCEYGLWEFPKHAESFRYEQIFPLAWFAFFTRAFTNFTCLLVVLLITFYTLLMFNGCFEIPSIQILLAASLGMRRSPLGDTATEPSDHPADRNAKLLGKKAAVKYIQPLEYRLCHILLKCLQGHPIRLEGREAKRRHIVEEEIVGSSYGPPDLLVFWE